jgi:hypothetical protein
MKTKDTTITDGETGKRGRIIFLRKGEEAKTTIMEDLGSKTGRRGVIVWRKPTT